MSNKINVIPSKKLMKIVNHISNEYYGGHFTIYSFTNHVKFTFGTITEREDIFDLEEYTDINNAIENAIQKEIISNDNI